MKPTDLYYDVKDDIEIMPDDTVFLIVYGGRATGKTYSVLRYVIENNITFMFLKREVEDVKNLCGGNTLKQVATKQLSKAKNKAFSFTFSEIDRSPFLPLNRDFGWNIRPFLLSDNATAGVFCCDNNGDPVGEPIGYIGALNRAGKFKGSEFKKMVDLIIFDEFCPALGDIVRSGEGDRILRLMKTLARDRKTPPLWAFANAEDVACPLTSVLEVIDNLCEMQFKDQEYCNLEKRHIFLHKLKTSEARIAKEKEDPFYQAIEGTKYHAIAYDNNFASNDFSSVRKIKLTNNFSPEAKIIHNRKPHYVWLDKRTGRRYITFSAFADKEAKIRYDLDTDPGKEAFFEYATLVLRLAPNGEYMSTFETYALYYKYHSPRLL